MKKQTKDRLNNLGLMFIMGLAILFLAQFASSAIDNIGPYQSNVPVSLVRSCSFNGIPSQSNSLNVSIYYPNGTTFLSWSPMTNGYPSSTFNYTLTFPTTGNYLVNGVCYNSTTSVSDSFNVLVNGSGQNVTQTQIILLMIGLFILLIFAGFFFLLSNVFKHPGVKIFFMAMSTLTLVTLIGIVASNGTVYLAEFPGIISIYNTYYLIMITFTGVAMAGLIVWLIYYSFTLFNKSRGRIPDE